MDFFAELFNIASNTPEVEAEAEAAPSAPFDAASGGTGGCIVA